MTTAAAIPGVNSAFSMNSSGAPQELFALTDEQILEIEPVAQGESTSPAGVPESRSIAERSEKSPGLSPRATNRADAALSAITDSAEPPPWLAAQMKDLWNGDEARDLWDGVQQARQEAAAFREVFDGGAGKSPQQHSADRAALAQRMLREDPAAFREMVFAGLRALEEAGQSPNLSSATTPSRSPNVVPPFRAASGEMTAAAAEGAGLKPANAGRPGTTGAISTQPAAEHPQLGEYRAFEKSANEELERSVGGAINRALSQALPDVQRGGNTSTDRARHAVPLQERLGGAIRADVETALKGDSQLGEQISQLLSARRFDDSTRAQVVRLINDRAQQLVPVAARRVIQDWTQTAFAAHRSRNEAASATHGESVPGSNGGASRPTSSFGNGASASAATTTVSAKAAAADRAESAVGLATRATSRVSGRPVDYRKLSDEQILEL